MIWGVKYTSRSLWGLLLVCIPVLERMVKASTCWMRTSSSHAQSCMFLQCSLATRQLHLLFLNYSFPFVSQPLAAQFHIDSCAFSLSIRLTLYTFWLWLSTFSNSFYSCEETLLGIPPNCVLVFCIQNLFEFLGNNQQLWHLYLSALQAWGFFSHVMCLTLAMTSYYKAWSPII